MKRKTTLTEQNSVYQRIRTIVEESRGRALYTVNTEMVQAYWLIGKEIVEEEQKGKLRAGYGKSLVENLSKKLTNDFDKGFDPSNLSNMRKFYLTFPIFDALRQELTWTHYRLLLKVDDSHARSFYEIECAKNRWSTRELE